MSVGARLGAYGTLLGKVQQMSLDDYLHGGFSSIFTDFMLVSLEMVLAKLATDRSQEWKSYSTRMLHQDCEAHAVASLALSFQ